MNQPMAQRPSNGLETLETRLEELFRNLQDHVAAISRIADNLKGAAPESLTGVSDRNGEYGGTLGSLHTRANKLEDLESTMRTELTRLSDFQ